MNTLLLGIGQAGTTISSIISQNLIEESKYFINLNSISCKSFLIDSESKVINNILNQNKKLSPFFSKFTNIITNNYGRGNNWALGHSLNFKEFRTENNINEKSYEYLKNYMEKCDFLDKIIVVHSLNGGTGSGVGTRQIEMIKDDFNKIKIFSCPVFGYNIENTCLSQFNCFFTISSIYDVVDGIIKLDNENIVSNKNMNLSDQIEANLICDFIVNSDKKEFNFEKYFFNNKFVDVGNFCDDFIVNYNNFTPEKMINKLYKNSKGKILTVDNIFKTKENKNKEYLNINKNMNKLLKCENNDCRFIQDKNLKNNKMCINTFYKSKNIEWLNNLIDKIAQKIQQR